MGFLGPVETEGHGESKGGVSLDVAETVVVQGGGQSTSPLLGRLGSGARRFETGATRDAEDGKLVFGKFLSPRVIECYAEYMHECRHLPDGTWRDGNNWQLGMGLDVFHDSLWRHFFDWWKLHWGLKAKDKKTGKPITIKHALCGVLFNAMGYLHEVLKAEGETP